jgi:hypothetical protein
LPFYRTILDRKFFSFKKTLKYNRWKTNIDFAIFYRVQGF